MSFLRGLAIGGQAYTEAKARERARQDALDQQAFQRALQQQAMDLQRQQLSGQEQQQEFYRGLAREQQDWAKGAPARNLQAARDETDLQTQAAIDAATRLSRLQVLHGLGPLLPDQTPMPKQPVPILAQAITALMGNVSQPEPVPPDALSGRDPALHPAPDEALTPSPLRMRAKTRGPQLRAKPLPGSSNKAGWKQVEATLTPVESASLEEMATGTRGLPFALDKSGVLTYTPPEQPSLKDLAEIEEIMSRTDKNRRDLLTADIKDALTQSEVILNDAKARAQELENAGYPDKAAAEYDKTLAETDKLYADAEESLARKEKIARETGNITEMMQYRYNQLELKHAWELAKNELDTAKLTISGYNADTARLNAQAAMTNAETARLRLNEPAGLSKQEKAAWDEANAAIQNFGSTPAGSRQHEYHRIMMLLSKGVSAGWLTPDQFQQSQGYLDAKMSAGPAAATGSPGGRIAIPKP